MSNHLFQAHAPMSHGIALFVGASSGLAAGVTLAFLIWSLV
jgi:hypothetical protein